jgi:Zn-dependent protease
MKLDQREMFDLLVSWATIGIAFAWVMSNFSILDFVTRGGVSANDFFILLPISLIVVGAGFICHELAHRYVAIHYGCHAKYRMWSSMLLLAILMALAFGIVFAAPGAVYIYGQNITRKQNGIISIAGPAMNIVLAGLFAMLLLFPANSWFLTLGSIGLYINIFLAIFNLLPVWQLDGAKVFAWNPAVWAGVFIPLLLAFFFVLM